MSNSIDNVPGNNPLSSTEQTSRIKEVAGKKGKDVDENRSQAADNKSAGSDEVVLTQSAQRLRSIEKELQSVPVTDKAKVQDVQQRINDGSFKVNAERIAEKLLATDKLLG